MKSFIWILVALAAGGLCFVQQRKIAAVRAESAALTLSLAEARDQAARAAEIPKVDPKESERLNQERAELAKLRGEVSALRKEKAEWEKKRGAAEAAALAASQAAQVAQPAAASATQGMQWVETILNGPSLVKGTETGNARRKALNGEPMTDAERALLLNMNSKAAEIEKSPEEFSTFQSSFISSLLGWNNDPRNEQVKGLLNTAMTAATSRGFDYHAPGQNADTWSDQQKALNNRATGAVQKMLTPEERAVFDKAFIGVLGVDTGAR